MTDRAPATELIHRGEGASPDVHPLTTPIYETSTFVFESAQEVQDYLNGTSRKYLYSRYENPTVVAVEQKIAVLDGAPVAALFSSGMAATSTILLTLLAPGDEAVCCSAIYGGTFHFFEEILGKFDVQPRFVSLDALSNPEAVLTPRTKLLWFETPINPTLRCVDIRRVSAACRARGVLSIIDNTFASSINQRPLQMGVDLSMQSATKYLNGHSDVTGGAVSGRADLMERLHKARRLLGTVLDPYPAYALGRGLKTLPLRVARHNANALAVAKGLEADRRVGRVYYPGLESHPDHQVAKSQMSGFGGVVCFDLDGLFDRACRLYDRLGLIKRAASLGGAESIVSLPVLTSHYGYSDDALERAGVTKGMLRLSVGLEDPADLLADLDQALA
jgi:cystathionine beta-lyase/cystathionine gamma-synthase